jgi:hypothetical protein
VGELTEEKSRTQETNALHDLEMRITCKQRAHERTSKRSNKSMSQ